jgi:hypothetical protein
MKKTKWRSVIVGVARWCWARIWRQRVCAYWWAGGCSEWGEWLWKAQGLTVCNRHVDRALKVWEWAEVKR